MNRDMHSLQFYQATLDSLTATIAIIDRHGTILFVNRSWRVFAKQNGADPDRVSEGCSYFSVCAASAAEGCDEARSFIEQTDLMLRGKILEFVLEYPCHSPEEQRWFQVRVTRLTEDWDNRIVVAHEDITSIKQAHNELQHREILLHNIVNVSPNLVFVKNSEDRYLIANNALAAMYGVRPEAMIGRDDVELITSRGLPSAEQEKFQQDDRRVFASCEPLFVDEESFTDHSGDLRWFRTVKAPIVIDGEARYLVGIANEITRDREQQQIVRTGQLRLQTILNSIHQEVLLLDTDERVVWANDQACTKAGMSFADYVGRSYDHIYCRDCNDIGTCPVHEVFLSSSMQRQTFVTNTGATLAVSVSPVIGDEQTVLGAVVVAEDISERLSLEHQLRQAQKLESLGTLAGGIAHDFNNILTAILGFTELCLDRATADPAMKEDLEEVYQASLRARELVHQILTFSRRTEQETKPLDIALIIKEAVKLLRSTLPSTIEIKSRIARDVGMVLADPTRIHQIMMNLCTNAAHAMRESGGILSLSLDTCVAGENGRTEQQLSPGRRYVRLEVGDTGCGMESDLLPLIFDPYFTTKQQGEGTGLGLAVVHGVVRDYGGAIDVASVPGRGSTFTVYLPRAVDEQHEFEDGHIKGELYGRGEYLLVVDDEPGLTRLAKKSLEAAGYQVYTENDSIQALTLIREKGQQIDLLITDMTMPGLTGERLALETSRLFPALPIILVSGNTARLPESLADHPAIEVVPKPVDRKQIMTVIRNLLTRSHRS
ncbi:MAG: PAS domain-containing protein [Desulfobulbaceae bacterium]|nr:PAS domain-containing protein [Desulfobulbaceae bacterium]